MKHMYNSSTLNIDRDFQILSAQMKHLLAPGRFELGEHGYKGVPKMLAHFSILELMPRTIVGPR